MARSAANGRKPKSSANKAAKSKNVEEDDVEQKNGHQEEENKSSSGGLLSECKKWFAGASDLYKVLDLDRTASQSQIKKAYYQISLRLHPDKVSESEREESTFKFQVLGRVYSILGDEEKRKVYDETGCIEGEDDEGLFSSDISDWEGYWRTLFKRVSKQDVDAFFASYRDSDEERADLLAAYEKFSGDMDLVLECVIGENVLDDEPRFKKIIDDAIAKQEVKSFDKYAKESKAKATKRRNKYEKEAEEAAEVQKKMGLKLNTDEDLVKALQARSKARAGGENFLDQLAAKYGALDEKKKPKRGGKNGKKAAAAVEDSDEEEDDSDSEFEENAKKKGKNGRGAATTTAATTKRVKRL